MSLSAKVPLYDLFASVGFSPRGEFEAFPIFMQLSLALLTALAAWFLIHNNQRRAQEETRRIERAKLLHELDREYMDIMALRCVIHNSDEVAMRPITICETIDAHHMWLFEMVLTKRIAWLKKVDCDAAPHFSRIYRYFNGARHIRVAEDYYVDTLTLHKVVAWSKRVASGVQARIISPADVTDMWRNILPWSQSNRFTFMASFFGVSEDYAPNEKRIAGMKDWHRKGVELPGLYLKRARASVSRLTQAGLNHMRTIKRGTPEEWSGDIAPLYVLIKIVISEAVKHDRVEILNYVGLSHGPHPDLCAQTPVKDDVDEIIRKVLLHPRPQRPQTLNTEAV